MNSNQKELQTTLQNILSYINNEYYIDLYLPDFKPTSGVDLSNRNKLVENTITTYKIHHEFFDDKKIKFINDDLLEIVKHDEVVYFQQTYIYKELYSHP